MLKHLSAIAVVLATTAHFSKLVLADTNNCAQGTEEILGNWYCQAVTTIQFTGLGSLSGTYNKVTNMDSTTGVCSSTAQSYAGNLSPLDEQVSLHFRGPLHLKQFAVYYPANSTTASKHKKREAAKAKRSLEARAKAHAHQHQHAHARFHKHNKVHDKKAEINERALPEVWVTATINGDVVSWINDWNPDEATSAAAAVATSSVAATSVVANVAVAAQVTSSSQQSSAAQVIATTLSTSVSSAVALASSTTSALSASTSTVSGSALDDDTVSNLGTTGQWTRTAYYNAEAQTKSGLTFLNHLGGSGSGTFDYKFGNSLSYASSDGTVGSATSTTLEDVLIPSNTELVVMTDTSCDDDAECGYSRNGTVAYAGFDGAEKLFLLEFSMPDDGTTGWNMNMPAIWMLNAQIPRTLQYGAASCSCWTTGCGELDLFEVLDAGNTRCKSTYHGSQSGTEIQGGPSDYFVRPTNATIQAAVTMNGDTATIKIIANSVSFTKKLSASAIQKLASNSWQDVAGEVSIFDLD